MENKGNSTEKRSVAYIKGGGFFAVAGALAVILSGYGYQWGWWDFGAGFRIWIPVGTVMAAVGGLTAVIVYLRMDSRPGKYAFTAFLSLAIGLIVVANSYYWYNEIQKGYPPIHDITTDTENPPEFNAIAPLRANAPNPVEYPGKDVADMQEEYYPDIETWQTDLSYSETYDHALDAAEYMPWNIVDENKEEGRIEAFQKLPWYGFTDDIVIRVDNTENGSKVDVRSKSRLGRGDLGVNAKRIRKYISRLEYAY